MIVYDVEQGTPEWLQARSGVPTASMFGSIMNRKGETTKTARKYALQLAVEVILGRPINSSASNVSHVIRGHTLEEQAALSYSFERSVTVETIGFATSDDGSMGASADRLVGVDGLLEIKCPTVLTHADYLVNGFEGDYYAQVQGQLCVMERDWVDRYSYHPELPSHVERSYRDSAFIRKLQDACFEVCAMRDEFIEKIRKDGMINDPHNS